MREEIKIKASREYSVMIDHGLLAGLGGLVRQTVAAEKIAILTDSNVDRLYGDQAMQSLSEAGFQVFKYVFPAGEASKNIGTVSGFVDFAAEHHLSRKDAILALGGGVTGDMAGFAASIYLRGIEFIQVPTSLLAAIDSSVGGKTGVNIQAGKNLMGTFWQPSLVVCDLDLFQSLNHNLILDGLAEILKTGAIYDDALFELASKKVLKEKYKQIISTCITIKGNVVEKDEKEGGLRRILNFGHTMGHAIEKSYNYQISHGEAVAKGMAIITRASEAHGLSAPGTYKQLTSGLTDAGLDLHCDIPLETLCRYAWNDKKAAGGKIALVYIERIGKAQVHEIETSKLFDFLSASTSID